MHFLLYYVHLTIHMLDAVYQMLLSGGLNRYLLSSERGPGFLSLNKEGVASTFGEFLKLAEGCTFFKGLICLFLHVDPMLEVFWVQDWLLLQFGITLKSCMGGFCRLLGSLPHKHTTGSLPQLQACKHPWVVLANVKHSERWHGHNVSVVGCCWRWIAWLGTLVFDNMLSLMLLSSVRSWQALWSYDPETSYSPYLSVLFGWKASFI